MNNYKVSFDWLSYTTDILDLEQDFVYKDYAIFEKCFLDFFKDSNNNNDDLEYLINSSNFLQKLIKILNVNETELSISNYGINGYKYSLNIGENIKLLFLNSNAKNNKGYYISQLLFNGTACKEFLHIKKGDFLELLLFLRNCGGKFKRLDIAIDDFYGKDFNIYKIPKLLENGCYISRFQNYSISSGNKRNTTDKYNEFQIRFGTRKNNSLVIYDKKLERINANDTFSINSDVWFRYELRLIDTDNTNTATAFVNKYLENASLENYKKDNEIDFFLKLALETLRSFIEFKLKDQNDSNKSRWKIRPDYQKFLLNLAAANLDITVLKVQSSMEKKLTFLNKQFKKTLALVYLSKSWDYLLDFMKQGLQEIIATRDTKNIAIVNNYLKLNKQPIYESIEQLEDINYNLQKEE